MTVHSFEIPVILPPRVWQIWGHIAQGKKNRDIARELGVKEQTVKTYCTVLYEGLGVENRTQATILYAKMRGRYG